MILEIVNGTYEFDNHPQFALDESLTFYSSDYPERPYIDTIFYNTFNTGVIIDEAIVHPEKEGTWILKLKTYNNLPIPLGVRLGKIREGTEFVIEPSDNNFKYLLEPSGNSIIQMVREGFTCEGVC